MNPKKNFSYFIGMQKRILQDLAEMDRKATVWMLFLTVFLVGETLLKLKFVEFATDDIYYFLENEVDYSIVIGTALVFLAGIVFFQAVSNWKWYIEVEYQARIERRVSERLAGKLPCISYEKFETSKIYDKIKLANEASWQYAEAINGLAITVQLAAELILYTVLLAPLGGWVLLFVMAALFLCFLVSGSVTGRQVAFWERKVAPNSRRNTYFREIQKNRISQATIQNTRSLSFFLDKYRYHNRQEAVNYVKLNAYSFGTEMMLVLFFTVAFIPAMASAGSKVVLGEFTVGYFTLLIALLIKLYQSVRKFLGFAMNQNWYLNVMDTYYEVMAWPEINHEVKKTQKTKYREGQQENGEENRTGSEKEISIENLRYIYPQSEKEVLRGITKNISPGERIAIVGLNGSGKTTLISVLCGLLTEISGSVSVHPEQIAVVFQDFVQYQMTIRENIEAGNAGRRLSEERIWEILQMVELYEYVKSLPGGIETQLGQLENGVELSKGQWQRLAIARLLARKDAAVWVMDEPTAFLDPIAEMELYQLAFRIAGNRTVFFISHRLGFARSADRILLMKEGQILEDGTHEELMKQNGEYANLYHMQEQWYL